MKKLALVMCSLTFLLGSAFADTTSIGVKLSYGNMDASGSTESNSAGTGSTLNNFVDGPAGGAKVVSSGDSDVPFGSIFIEREREFSKANVAIGLDWMPLSAEVEKLGGGTGTDATIEIGNQFTIYIQPSKELSNGVKVFGKLGYSSMNLEINDIKYQASTAGTANTDGNTTKNMDGIMFGLGFEKSVSVGPLDFIRLEATYTDYDTVNHTSSNGKKQTADADLTALNLSIGKKF